MLFSSITFLYVFLPLVLLVYFVVPKVFKNPVLFLFSLIFYAWGEPKYVVLMIGAILSGYIFGLLIERYRGTQVSKLFMGLSLLTSLGMLAVFKYADFFVENINAIVGIELKQLHLSLPIGISFYTFQILSYTIDVYRGNVAAQKNLITLGTYISLFPQLIAGPIVRYVDVEKQLTERTRNMEQIALGVRRFVLGLAKKVLLANQLGELCEIFRATNEKSVLFYWMYAIAFTLHIYFDFSGYSDMAIGLGKIFGFTFMENFNYPYISKSITEFWRRWHISLGSWFRDYVYIPLGGNRVSKSKWVRNIFIVWFLTGMWHGAAWNFILWGLLFAVLLFLEKVWLYRVLEKTKIFKHFYVIFFVTVSFVLFNAASLEQFFNDLFGLFGVLAIPVINETSIFYLKDYAIILIMGCILATPCMQMLWRKLAPKRTWKVVGDVLELVGLPVLFLVVTAYLIDGSFNPFLYFRF